MKNLCLSITIMLSMICNLATAVPAPSEIVGLQPSEK